MGVSTDVSIGDDILALDHNRIHQDLNDDALSHNHSAAGRNGIKIKLNGLDAEVLDKLSPNNIQRISSAVSLASGANTHASTGVNVVITSVDITKTYVIHQGASSGPTGPGGAPSFIITSAQLVNATTVSLEITVSANGAGGSVTASVTTRAVVVEWG